ncbi:MAG: gliding motility lipoprotein GldD [Bacteroidales bacterium]|jgi:gliding motility-associated lipoprotein GldD
MKGLRQNNPVVFLAVAIIAAGCRDTAVPKPKGYFRIDFPEKTYILLSDSISKKAGLPLSFEYPSYCRIFQDTDYYSEPGWVDIDFPLYRAKIYLTYKPVRNDLVSLMEQSYRMDVKNHVIKADAIDEQVISKPEEKVYGILYDLKGNTATAVQFFVTDSTKHFFRGSLYFNAEPNADSLEPAIAFFRKDIVHMIETLKWKEI